jgi:hypothetical protein
VSILQSEPQHKIADFVDEMTERARDVIAVLGPEMQGMLRDLLSSFRVFLDAHYCITFKDVRIVETRWLKEGRLLITFALGANPDPTPFARHIIVDDFVDDTLAKFVPEEFRDEMSGFIRAMVYQFAMMKKHSGIDLRRITFATVQWPNERQVLIPINLDGRPLAPRTTPID